MTGKERLERLYRRLKKNFPDKDIRFDDQSLYYRNGAIIRYKVSYWDKLDGQEYQICDAIWSNGSFGYPQNLLEFCGRTCQPEGYITERMAYNLFLKFIKGN